MNEVQVITYVNPTIEKVFYTGIIEMVDDGFGLANFEISPITGLNASDILYLSCRIINPNGEELTFQIQTSVDNTTYWTLSQNSIAFGDIVADFRFLSVQSKYEIYSRTILIPASGTLVENTPSTPSFTITPAPSVEGKNISITWSNGDYYYGKVLAQFGATIVVSGVPNPSPYAGLTAEYRIETDSIPRYLDLYPNESISQNFRFTDVSNLTSVGSFSREFRIPASPLNRDTFGFLDEVNFNSQLNYYHRKLPASILVDSLPIATGFIRAMKTYIQNGELSDFEISFYAETPDLFKKIGDKRLKDLVNIDAFTHYKGLCSPSLPLGSSVLLCCARGNEADNNYGTGQKFKLTFDTGLSTFLVPPNGTEFDNKPSEYVFQAQRFVSGVWTNVISINITRARYINDKLEITLQSNPPYTYTSTDVVFWRIISVKNGGQYILTDNGQKWSNDDEVGTRRIDDTTNPVNAGDLCPHYSAKYIFDSIIKDAGFSLTDASDTALTSAIGEWKVPLPTNSDKYDELIAKSFLSGAFNPTYVNNGNTFIGGQFSMQFTPVVNPTLFDIDTISYNNDNYTTTTYEVFQQGIYSFKLYLTFNEPEKWIVTSASQGTNFLFIVKLFSYQGAFINNEMASNQYVISRSNFAATGQYNLTLTYSDLDLFVPSGSKLWFKFEVFGLNQEITLYPQTNGLFNGTASIDYLNGCGFECTSVKNIKRRIYVDYKNENCPDWKNVDFVKDILNMTCSVLMPDKEPNKLVLMPIKDYLQTGDIVDWTHKLDISKDIILSPTTDLLKRKLLFTYKEGGDVASKLYKQVGRIYGQYLQEGVQVDEYTQPNDFAQGDLTIQLNAESNPSNYIGATGYVISKYVDNSYNYVKPNLRFVYVHSDQNASVIGFDDIIAQPKYMSFGTTSNYSKAYPSITDLDLNFAPDIPLHNIEGNPYNNLYNLYWREYINELYAPNARILEAFFSLTLEDIRTFSFADTIWIKDAYYRILEIQDYKVGQSESTKVVLLKIIPDSGIAGEGGCGEPKSQNPDGSLIFYDSNNNVIESTETCCVQLGYRWDRRTGSCFSTNGGTNSNDSIRPVDSRDKPAIVSAYGDILPKDVIGITIKSDVKSGNNFSSIIGRQLQIDIENGFSTIQGDVLKLEASQPASVVQGANAIATIKGIHYGGGWRGNRMYYDTEDDSSKGIMQMGSIVMYNVNEYTALTPSVEVFVGNDVLTRLVLPSNTQWVCKLLLSVNDAAGYWYYGEWNVTIWENGGTYSSTPVMVQEDSSTILEQYYPVINTGSGTDFRFEVWQGASVLATTGNVNVIVQCNYIQTRKVL